MMNSTLNKISNKVVNTVVNKVRNKVILLSLIGFSALTLADGSSKQMEKLVTLNVACEQDRQRALASKKHEIYQECINHYKKSAATCQDEASAYNGNRINGAPLYYDLPSCEKAFEFKKKMTEKE